MNKEVIYLEPEDDITDILTKLQQAEQKLVALVPPKKATMLRSAVNMKLVARVAKECEKVAVIVTADPAIIKMAMAAKIPIAKTLQSRPVVPTEESLKTAESEILDDDITDIEADAAKSTKDDAKSSSKASSIDSKADSAKSAATIDLTEESLENDSKDPKNNKKSSKKDKKSPSDKKVPSMDKYRKLIMIGIPAAIIAIVVLVWAFVFAPAVTITVAISSTPSNFTESIRFTTDPNAENIAEGIFLVEKQSNESKYRADFTATGEEDRGEKASGKVTVSVSFSPRDYTGEGYGVQIAAGDKFVSGGKTYTATSSASAYWNGNDMPITCDNTTIGSVAQLGTTCRLSATVSVEATSAGESYNLDAGSTWENFRVASVSNSSPISGGTTNLVKVVSQKDVDDLKEAQISEHTVEGKSALLEDLSKELIPIESSFAAEAGDVSSTPAIGDEVGSNTTPNATITVVYSVYAVERSKVEEYIKQKTTLAEDQKIYSIDNPYFERFTTIEEPARLKATIEIGPTVTEETILEKAKGRKTGEVQSSLRSITGVSSVEIRTSYFWVWSVPTDPNKITVNLKVEDNK